CEIHPMLYCLNRAYRRYTAQGQNKAGTKTPYRTFSPVLTHPSDQQYHDYRRAAKEARICDYKSTTLGLHFLLSAQPVNPSPHKYDLTPRLQYRARCRRQKGLEQAPLSGNAIGNTTHTKPDQKPKCRFAIWYLPHLPHCEHLLHRYRPLAFRWNRAIRFSLTGRRRAARGTRAPRLIAAAKGRLQRL